MVASRSSSVSSGSSTPDDQINIFVKNLNGETIPLNLPTSTTVPALLHLISLRTNKPTTSLRLSHASRPLTSPSATLASLGLTDNVTLTLSSPLRGGAAAAADGSSSGTGSGTSTGTSTPTGKRRMRCGMKDCRERVPPIVGDCGFCHGRFCARHRMLEDHACPNLEDCKKESKERNAFKLESERTVASQGLGY